MVSSSSPGKSDVPASGRFLPGLLATARTAKYEHLLAGVSGGVVSTLVLHPLDLLKIRFAGRRRLKGLVTSRVILLPSVDDGKDLSRPKYTGLRNAFGSVVRDEGFRGLYKGVTPNVTGAGASWGFYFLL